MDTYLVITTQTVPFQAATMIVAGCLWFGYWLPLTAIRYQRLMRGLRAGR